MRGIKLPKPRIAVDQETLEGFVYFLNSVIFLGLGATILRLSDVVNLHIERVRLVAPDYVQYIGAGFTIGYLLLFFAILQMFFAAMKFFEARSMKRVEVAIKQEVRENASE